MALHVNRNQKRTPLQERLDDELRAKMEASRNKELISTPDGVDDSAYIKGTKQTSSIGWAWIVIVIAVILIFLFFVYSVNTV